MQILLKTFLVCSPGLFIHASVGHTFPPHPPLEQETGTSLSLPKSVISQ